MKKILFLAIMFCTSLMSAQTAKISIKKENAKSHPTQDVTWTFSTPPQTISGLTEPDTLIIDGDTILTNWPDTLIINFDNDFYNQYNGHTVLILDTIINESPLTISKVIAYGAQCTSCEFTKISEDAVAPYDFTIPDVKLRLVVIATTGTGKISTKTTLKKTELISDGISVDSVNALISDSIATVGGNTSDFYEYMALIRWNNDSMDWVIDSVVINTFPSYFYRNSGGDPALGFTLKCSSCGPTVDFTTFVSGSANYVEFLSPSTWFYYDNDDSKVMPIFLIYTPTTPDIVNITLIKADGTNVDAGAFDDGEPVDALPIHFKYKIGS